MFFEQIFIIICFHDRVIFMSFDCLLSRVLNLSNFSKGREEGRNNGCASLLLPSDPKHGRTKQNVPPVCVSELRTGEESLSRVE